MVCISTCSNTCSVRVIFRPDMVCNLTCSSKRSMRVICKTHMICILTCFSKCNNNVTIMHLAVHCWCGDVRWCTNIYNVTQSSPCSQGFGSQSFGDGEPEWHSNIKGVSGSSAGGQGFEHSTAPAVGMVQTHRHNHMVEVLQGDGVTTPQLPGFPWQFFRLCADFLAGFRTARPCCRRLTLRKDTASHTSVFAGLTEGALATDVHRQLNKYS